MKIRNVRLFLGRSFVPGGIVFDQIIREAGPQVRPEADAIDGGGCLLIPGLVDIHTHAAVGEDASDGRPEGLEKMARYYAAGGVTSWCPATMTLPEDALIRAMQAISRVYKKQTGNQSRPGGARIAGINLEGPFLSLARCGAQNPAFLKAPDPDLFDRLNEASGGLIRLVTVAPELPGAMDFIRRVRHKCTVSLGHTDADYDSCMAAFEAGASHVTHLFNAMTPPGHRAPGLPAAAFDSGVSVELITDGQHIHPAMVRLAFSLFRDRLALISDSLACAGMPDGQYCLGGQAVTLLNGRAVLTGTDTLAGSAIHLMDGIKKAAAFGIPLETAVYSATALPAKVIGMDACIGSLEPGKAADFVLLTPDLSVKAVYIDGKPVTEA